MLKASFKRSWTMNPIIKERKQKPLKIFTWHVHGNYLYYLSHVPHTIYLPVLPERTGDYQGKAPGFPWGSNVIEVDVKDVPDLELDCILFQRPAHYLADQYKIFSGKQRRLPRIYLEHDPPFSSPTGTRHWVDDPDILLVHVTHYNDLMWDSGHSPTMVIENGVSIPEGAGYTGNMAKGIVVVNNIPSRGRRLCADLFEYVNKRIRLDVVGMGAEIYGGKEISHSELPYLEIQYRFFFNPIRYTSLGLAVCEAMMLGMPIIGFATTEMATVIRNGYNGYVYTDIHEIITRMKQLLHSPDLGRKLGENARSYANKRFNI